MSEHELKTWPPFFEHVLDGTKPFDVRRNDRGFAPGDVLHLREFHPDRGYTGREVRRTVSYLFDLGAPMFGLPGVVVLGITPTAQGGNDADER